MRKIINQFTHLREDTYNCLVCSPHNPIGLKLEFWEDGDEVFAEWDPDRNFEGYHGVIHGGIQATLMDEVAAWTVYVKCATAGVTTGMDIKYKRPANSLNGTIKVIARIKEKTTRLATVEVRLENNNGQVATESVVHYFLFPEEKARKDFKYPGVDAFFE